MLERMKMCAFVSRTAQSSHRSVIFCTHQSPPHSGIQWSPWHHEPAHFLRDSLRQYQRLPANGLRPPGREGAGQECHPAHQPHHSAVPSRQGYHQARPPLPGEHPRETGVVRLAPQIMIVKEKNGPVQKGGEGMKRSVGISTPHPQCLKSRTTV